MKILYITNGICGVGGLERVLAVKTALLIEKYGYDIHILSLNEWEKTPFYPFSPLVSRHHLPFHGYSPWHLCAFLRDINRLIQSLSPDIVDVCDDGMKGFLIPYLPATHQIPIIYERHVAQEITQRHWWSHFTRAFQRHCAGKYDKFILLCNGHKKDWPLSNTEVIPNVTSFRPASPSRLENKRLIAVGKISYQKAYEYLLDVWTKLEPHFPDWEVCLYGEENDGGALREEIHKRGLKRFALMGRCSDMMHEYLRSSIHVMTSRFEGLPMVMIEAQSCGLPSVSFDCPYGPSEIIQDGINGYLLPMGDVDGMATKLSQLMTDHSLLQRQGQAARETSLAYSDSTIVNRWHQLFSSLVKHV